MVRNESRGGRTDQTLANISGAEARSGSAQIRRKKTSQKDQILK
uniref:Uncharacterized protein n=1 Tax=Arundo donax TaxID=35708 RepID=A0A0A8ZQG9_ARUDO